MATPVGPAAPDPHDPDLWEEWYRDDTVDDHDEVVGHHLSTPVRVVALVVLVAMVLLIVATA